MKKPHITTLGAPSHGSESHDEYRSDIEFTADSATEAGSSYSSAGGSDSARQGAPETRPDGVARLLHPAIVATVYVIALILIGAATWSNHSKNGDL